MKHFISNSLEDTQKIASDWLCIILNRYSNSDEAVVAGLSGHLGAGKTAFVKALAKELMIDEDVTSPTFVIMKVYEIPKRALPWKRLVHIDAYRLEKIQELEALRYEELVADPHNLIVIEWPENVGLEEFGKMCRLTFDIREGKRHISIS